LRASGRKEASESQSDERNAHQEPPKGVATKRNKPRRHKNHFQVSTNR
jgi:hypothetical protein